MLNDIQISRRAILKPILGIARGLSIESENLIHYGRFMAEVKPAEAKKQW